MKGKSAGEIGRRKWIWPRRRFKWDEKKPTKKTKKLLFHLEEKKPINIDEQTTITLGCCFPKKREL